MRWWPRSIRWQMLLGLVLLEVLSIALFGFILIQLQNQGVRDRVRERLVHQTTTLALDVEEALEQKRPDWAGVSVRMAGGGPSVMRAKVTDAQGNVQFVSAGDPAGVHLSAQERAEIPHLTGDTVQVFALGGNRWESARPIYVGFQLRGYAWMENDPLWDDEQIVDTVRATLIFGAIWIMASAVLVLLVWRLIAQPLETLHRGTRALISLPQSRGTFPLPVTVNNEFGELVDAFNRMVAAIEEQRAGLTETLSLLDSMLANAPVGLAFFDRQRRFVRVNQSFADLMKMPVSRMVGRTMAELMPGEATAELERAIAGAFAQQENLSELELSGGEERLKNSWSWLVSVYPVRTTPDQVRWAGIIVRDVSERARAEEALRKSEKLAATGRLAASIAHEINNPLEAITNLLFLLRNFSGLSPAALQYLTMAEHETRRITEIAQQTLRFYRQSTLPQRASLAELLDSVLDLYKGRMNTLDIAVERDYDSALTLFCFSGEIRQVIANLVGNAVDAMGHGGRLVVRARRSHRWSDGGEVGIRLTVGDTGSGMDADTLERIFEAFFTTKEEIGTGLGLWVSHEIIQKHRGYVKVRSRSGAERSGTVFYLFLPDDESLSAPPRIAAQAPGSQVQDVLSQLEG